MAFEKLRAINKSISNAVGSWHQAVLGLAEGWKDLGCSGGDVDLMVRESSDAEPIAVEVRIATTPSRLLMRSICGDKLESFSENARFKFLSRPNRSEDSGKIRSSLESVGATREGNRAML